MSRTKDDSCAIQQQYGEYSQKLRYVTNNFVDLKNATQDSNAFSLGFKNGLFTPSDKTETESELKLAKVTNERAKTGFGELPLPTMPGMYFQNAYGDPEVEKDIYGTRVLRDYATRQFDGEFYNRTFPQFSSDSVFSNMGNFVEAFQRGGDSSRVYKTTK